MRNIPHDQVKALMRQAAEAEVLPRFRNLRAGDIAFKGENDPVTIADQLTEIFLTRELSALLPNSLVVGEEGVAQNPDLLKNLESDSWVWIIDPIDGTNPFTKGEPNFGVMVALSKGEETLAGWIYHPLSGEFVSVEKGAGAYHQEKRLSVLPQGPLNQCVGSLAYQGRHDFPTTPDTPRLTDKPYWASCVSAPHLVVGRPFFSCPEGTQWHYRALRWKEFKSTPWDDVIPTLLITESGGATLGWDGEPFIPTRANQGFIMANTAETCQGVRKWAIACAQ